MNLMYLTLLCGLIATIFVYKSEARLHAESILGGIPATVHQNTYAVSIQINDWHLCGGGILNNRYIITAAHPFIDSKNNRFINKEYFVVAGATKAHNTAEQYRTRREVAKIYIPREYSSTMVANFRGVKTADIAVLELKSDLGLNGIITNVVLPPHAGPHLTYENELAVVCAYGDNWVTMRHDADTNRAVEVCSGSDCYERRFAQVNILPNIACRNFVRDITDSQLCGKMRQRSPAHPEGLCTGDSGSPLVFGNTIIGVVSISPEGCREDILPAIYTRVTSFIPFIINAMTGVREPNMRVAEYKVISRGRRISKKLLLEQ